MHYTCTVCAFSLHDCVAIDREHLCLHKHSYEVPVLGWKGLYERFLQEKADTVGRLNVCDGMEVQIAAKSVQVSLHHLLRVKGFPSVKLSWQRNEATKATLFCSRNINSWMLAFIKLLNLISDLRLVKSCKVWTGRPSS